MPSKWRNIGWLLTAVWVTLIAMLTGGDPTHPAFDFFFTVPLAGWIGALIVARLLKLSSDDNGPRQP